MKTLKPLFIALLASILTLGIVGTVFAAVPASMQRRLRHSTSA